MSRVLLPPLPRDFRGEFLTPPDDLSPWAGASGPFWLPPLGVLRPGNDDDVAAAVRWAGDEGVALVPRGGGTGMPGGNVSRNVVLDLSRMDRLSPLEPVESTPGGSATLRAGAGATGAALLDAARTAGWDLPALPSSAPWCTLGGMLACNAAGARSFRYGPARTWVREIEWVRADGSRERVVRGEEPREAWIGLRGELEASLPSPLPWPRVRKNSSGYALDAFLAGGDPVDLAVGSEGTLGVITGASLDLVPPPAARAVALVGVPSPAFLSHAAAEAAEVPAAVACEYFGRRLVELGGLEGEPRLASLHLGEGFLLFEVAGEPDAVEAGLREVARLAGDAGVAVARDPGEMARLWKLRHAASPTIQRALARGLRSTQFIEDSVVPVAALGDYVRGLGEILTRHDTDAVLFGHAGDGNLHVNPLVDLHRAGWRDSVASILRDTVALVAELGGTLAGEHGDGRLRTPFLDRIYHPAVVSAFATVKARLDPGGILNPGVIVPHAGADPLAGLGDAPGFACGSQGPEARP